MRNRQISATSVASSSGPAGSFYDAPSPMDSSRRRGSDAASQKRDEPNMHMAAGYARERSPMTAVPSNRPGDHSRQPTPVSSTPDPRLLADRAMKAAPRPSVGGQSRKYSNGSEMSTDKSRDVPPVSMKLPGGYEMDQDRMPDNRRKNSTGSSVSQIPAPRPAEPVRAYSEGTALAGSTYTDQPLSIPPVTETPVAMRPSLGGSRVASERQQLNPIITATESSPKIIPPALPIPEPQVRRAPVRRESFHPSAQNTPYSRDVLLKAGSVGRAEVLENEEAAEEDLEDETMANVEEMLEGFDFGIDHSGQHHGTTEAIEARLLDELKALDAVSASRSCIGTCSRMTPDNTGEHTRLPRI